jgi:hypothetical protein
MTEASKNWNKYLFDVDARKPIISGVERSSENVN